MLGTSNSILKEGWVPALEAISAPEDSVLNYSCGANCSAYGLYALDHFKILDSVDSLVIDFTLNDQGFCDAGILEYGEVESYYYNLVKRICESGVKPVSVLFFNQKYIDKDSFPVRDMHIDICRHFGVEVIDLFSIVNHLKTDHNPNTFFQDPAHLGPHFSKHVAVLVRDYLKSLTMDERERRPNAPSPRVFRGVSLAAEFPGLPKVRRGTSYITHESLHLEGDNAASLPLGRVVIDSVFFRASRLNGYLSFESNGKALSKVVAYQEQRGFFCRSVRPVFEVEGEVKLCARNIPGAPLCENDIHQVEPPEDAPGTFDLVGLLVRDPVPDDIEYERGASPDKQWVKRYRESLRNVKLVLNNQLDKVDAPESLYIAATLAADSSLAIAAIEKALKLAGDNTYYHAQYGARLSKAKMLKKAASALADAVRLAPGVSAHHMFLSHIHGGLGNVAAGLSAVEAAIAIKEDHSGYHHRRGNLLFQMGNLDEAERAQNRSLELDPEAADAHFQLSRIHEKRGDLERALSEIRTALAIKGDDSVYRAHLARLMKLG